MGSLPFASAPWPAPQGRPRHGHGAGGQGLSAAFLKYTSLISAPAEGEECLTKEVGDEVSSGVTRGSVLEAEPTC